jgi:hypothetical protein
MRALLVWLQYQWITSRLRRGLRYFTKGERALRWHLQRARALGCASYCLYHACDSRECANDPIHD